MIPWKPTSIAPEEGRSVVCLSWHWKKKFPHSMEIMGGEVEYCDFTPTKKGWRCHTNDYSGAGAYATYCYTDIDCDFDAWCYAEEFKPVFPNFLEIEKS